MTGGKQAAAVFKKVLKSKCGEGYIDTVIGVLCSMMVIVLALNVFSFLALKQNMDYFAKELLETAVENGRIGVEVNERYAELEKDTGIHPSAAWDAAYFNSSAKTVQLGDTIKLTLTDETTFKGFGVFGIPITLTATHSGLSQKYWK